jgi:hypothetical protein
VESATFCMGYETFMGKVTEGGFLYGFFQVWKVGLFVSVFESAGRPRPPEGFDRFRVRHGLGFEIMKKGTRIARFCGRWVKKE